MLLAGDIGGTKTNLALFEESDSYYRPQHLMSFHSKEHNGLEEIVLEYLRKVNVKPSRACFAIAGPVEDGICKTTNLPWLVDAHHLSEVLHLKKVGLINDLLANAYAIEILSRDSISTIYPGRGKTLGNRAVVSPGTGLGEAGIIHLDGRYIPFASEGGHSDFAPANDVQLELWKYLKSKWEHVSYERVLSGPGFLNIYEFFKKEPEPQWLQDEMVHHDHAAVITKNALNGKSEVSKKTLTLFVEILAQEVGNVALKFLATGGIYLGGGIPPKILLALQDPLFLKSYLSKGRFNEFLEAIPISVILDDKASLKGAACFARN